MGELQRLNLDLLDEEIRNFFKLHAEFDPYGVDGDTSLESAGLISFELFKIMNALEATFEIEMDPDLINSLECIGDLRYYVRIKLEQLGHGAH